MLSNRELMTESFTAQSGGRDPRSAEPASFAPRPLDKVIERSLNWLLREQTPEGYWWGELEADTTLESDGIVYFFILASRAPAHAEPEKIRKLANFIRSNQLPDGGWNIYAGGPAEINATVKAFFALKLAGDSPGSFHLDRARQRILALGGIEATNSYTRFYLAIVGAVGWEMVPAIPPELMLLPNWFYINLLEMSSWTRAIIVPLTILYALRAKFELPAHARVDELFLDASRPDASFAWDSRVISWRNLFLTIDRTFKFLERLPWKPFRRRALDAASRWIFDHLERSEGLATIYPAMVNSIYALLTLGYGPDDPLTAREIAYFRGFEIEDGEFLRIQPCISPVWDTAIALSSVAEAGLPPDHPAMVNSARWLLDHQILGPGDWQYKNSDGAPGGWAFEFRNDFFPDVDDTAFVLMSLARVRFPDSTRMNESARRGLAWMLSMQNRDGGWGAFDRDNDRSLLTHIPFSDHNAMIDPATADVTARVLECLGRFGWPASQHAVARGIKFLERTQEKDGPWYGRWGVNYIYGSSSVLRALENFSLATRPDFRRAGDWLRSVQNPDGGFGETIASYDDPSKRGKGISTPSQTAWAVIGLLTLAGPDDAATQRAVTWLIDNQNPDGTWNETEFTGTGFPRVFYLKYHLYRNSFPLYALARYRNLLDGRSAFPGLKIAPERLPMRHPGGTIG
jgi:squalene-hopene/tetraprenyl-beta-curcumene cyclase